MSIRIDPEYKVVSSEFKDMGYEIEILRKKSIDFGRTLYVYSE